MNKRVVTTSLQMNIPDFGLSKGSAAGFDMINYNKLTGEVKGGITIIVMG